MGRRSTRFRIAFFSVLLAGLIIMQYSWVRTLQKEKLQDLQSVVIRSLESTGRQIAFSRSQIVFTESVLTNLLHQSFSANGLDAVRFEFLMGWPHKQLASRGFSEKLKENPDNLILYYQMPPSGVWSAPDNTLTFVVLSWKTIVWKEMGWTIAVSVLFTIMMVVIFYIAIIWGDRRQQLFYDKREKVIRYMMQQLETPLSTVSVATEALRNTSVMQDSSKTNYYQQVINEENKRMREQVEKLLRELK